MISKNMIIQTMANNVGINSMQNGGSGVSQIIKISECPDSIRHACCMAGITWLPKMNYTVCLDGYGQFVVPYYFCNKCGKLFIYNDFI